MMRRLVQAVGHVVGAGVVVVTLVVAGVSAATASPVAPNIVGGHDAEIAEFPFVVALTYASNGEQFCGGTLVAQDKVVTASHCAYGQESDDVGVVSGRTTLSSGEGVESQVSDIWIHPKSGTDGANYDVAVLTLAEPVEQRPATLATVDDAAYQPGTKATVLGWGDTSESGSPSDHLQGVQVPITTDDYCSDAYGVAFRESGMVCAGLEAGGKDACQGDSGGPLVVGDTLVGVVSWGEGCARPGKPGVYAKVGAFSEELSREVYGGQPPAEPEPTTTEPMPQPAPTTTSEPSEEPAPMPQPAPTTTSEPSEEPAPMPQPAPTTTSEPSEEPAPSPQPAPTTTPQP